MGNLTSEQLSNVYRFVALMATTEEYFVYVSNLLIDTELNEYRKQLTNERKPVKDYEYRIIDKRCVEKRKELEKKHNKLLNLFKTFSKEFSSDMDETMIQTLIDGINEDILKIKLF